MSRVSFFTVMNVAKKYDKINILYALENKSPENINCTTNGDIVPKKYRNSNINSKRTRDLGLLDVFDFNKKIWRTILMPFIKQIKINGRTYKFGGR